MNSSEFLHTILFTISGRDFTLQHLSSIVLILLICFIIHRLLNKVFFPKLYEDYQVDKNQRSKINSLLKYVIYLSATIGIIWSLDLDYNLILNETSSIRITRFLNAIIIIQLARLLYFIFSKIVLHDYYVKRDIKRKSDDSSDLTEEFANKNFQNLLIVAALLLIIKNFNLDFQLFTFDRSGEVFNFKISNIFVAIFIFLIARLIYWIATQLILYGYYKRIKVNMGSQYAINQLLKYFIYTIAFIVVLQNLGLQMTLILGGAAALLVGVGLGLQQTFNDFFSGIVLLFERSVEVGDVLQVGAEVGTVRNIGLRASQIEGRNNKIIIVPNSKLVNDNVVNWSSNDDKVRFHLNVGVSYDSDAEEVKSLLVQAAKENPYILNYPGPFVRLTTFADYSLNFELIFWSRNFIVIEDIKSDLRIAIHKIFKEHHIEIPFPKQDINLIRRVKDSS